MKTFFTLVIILGLLAVTHALSYTCYPNGTIVVTNPNSAFYTDVIAAENEGIPTASECTVSTNGASVTITDCSQDEPIAVHFSNRTISDSVFGGTGVDTYVIQCNQIPDAGIARTIDDGLIVTLPTTSESAVTPDFQVTSTIRGSAGALAATVTTADVGDTLTWTIDIPSDYTARPSCTAYSGTTTTGYSKTLFINGCSQDSDLLGGDFTGIETSIALTNRYYVTLYAFRFYDDNDVFFHCTVEVCPSDGTANCAITCLKKRSVETNNTTDTGSRYFDVTDTLRVFAGNSTPTTLGSLWLVLTTTFMVLHK